MEGAVDNSWFLDQANWVEQVASALKFLSGDVLGNTEIYSRSETVLLEKNVFPCTNWKLFCIDRLFFF
jgi:hypothetical protein